MKKIKNHANEVYGRLTVLQFIERKEQKSYWKCRCSCGKEITIPISYLTSGDTKSCGCLKKEIVSKREKEKAFIKNHRLYNIWQDMKRRCYNLTRNSYKYYGAKNIIVCDEWKNNFKIFQNWAFKNGYNDKLTIDRIDNKKGYTPNNCRWVTRFEQNNNMSTNHKIIYENKIYNSMSSFCREKNINYDKFRQKIRHGYTIQDALTSCGVR